MSSHESPNPYESPTTSPREVNAAPWWYVCFYKVYVPAWWIGTALIVLNWLDVVSSTVGWAGFALAAVSALGSYVLPSLARVQAEDHVSLDSRLLHSKGDAYYDAIERFRSGAALSYDGVAFGFRPDNEIACGIVADTPELSERAAAELAAHAQSVFDLLRTQSAEFRSAVSGRRFRISIMSGDRELCRVVDGRLDWRR